MDYIRIKIKIRNSKIHTHENEFEIVVYNMRPFCLDRNALSPEAPKHFVGHFE